MHISQGNITLIVWLGFFALVAIAEEIGRTMRSRGKAHAMMRVKVRDRAIAEAVQRGDGTPPREPDWGEGGGG